MLKGSSALVACLVGARGEDGVVRGSCYGGSPTLELNIPATDPWGTTADALIVTTSKNWESAVNDHAGAVEPSDVTIDVAAEYWEVGDPAEAGAPASCDRPEGC